MELKGICCNGREGPGKGMEDEYRRNIFGNQKMSSDSMVI
jgi:hypothetical protein